ncbi:MAG: hypothetical protein K5849_06915 [Bacteroidales bacterium]|nr:hypothetical protein [Bacteroidales bacterium]
MKKIFSIISAGVIALTAVSCIQEPLATFDPSKATAPIMGETSTTAKSITVSYSPAVLNQGFNEQIAPSHVLAIISVNGDPVSRIVTSQDSGNTLTATLVNISKALAYFGYKDGDSLSSVELAVRATLQTLSQDNGINGYVDSESSIVLNNFTVTIPVGSPYADYTELSSWSVIGSLSEYGISWDGDLEVFETEDGNHLVAKAVKLTKDDEFKFRKDLAWDVNMGGAFGSLDAPFSVTQDGDNIKVGADGTYDLWLDLEAGTATVTDAYMAYPDHKDASAWTVIGSLSEYGISWDGDLPMITDGSTHVAQGIKIAAADEFKFRKDLAWDVNMGGAFGSLGSPFAVTQDGDNIKVGQDGVYDLILDPTGTATVVETLGGGVSGKIGGDEPEPEPVTGWNIIGANGDWDNDILATENGGVWTAYVNATAETEFKWRKDGAWDENYGGAFTELGTPFTAVAGGDNIKVSAGFYQVVLDLSSADPTITVSKGDVFGLIGVGGDWDHDIYMTLSDGKWVSPATAIEGEFKIRRNAAWDENYGGTFAELDKPFEAVAGGSNIKLEAGEYVVTFDPTAKTITVSAALPSNLWSVIGDFNGWAADAYMTQVAPGIWVSGEIEVTAAGWKVRYNNSWDVNRGGATPAEVGQFAGAYPGGDNLTLEGKVHVVYNEMNQTIGTLGWGVVGKIASIPGFEWNNDIPMNLASDGKWYSVPVTLAASDEIKIRWNGAWDKNYGAEANEGKAADTPFATGGENFKAAADGTYMVVFDPTANTITLSTDFWSLIGDFNSWGGDRFMLPDGSGKWFAYNQEISGGWKIRKGAAWTVSAGGTYAKAGEAFAAVTTDGPNIAVTDMTRFDVVYDTKAGNITVSAPVK